MEPNIPEDSKLLLAANELVYNNDTDKVIARGAVQINYGGYKLVARQVEYDQKTGRLKAVGNIELIEPTGDGPWGAAPLLSNAHPFPARTASPAEPVAPATADRRSDDSERVGGGSGSSQRRRWRRVTAS